jgi:hypothetical protein
MLLNETGQVLAMGEPFTVLDVVLPGGKAPFGLLFTSPPGRFASFQAVIVRAEPSIEPGGRYARLVVQEPQGGTDGLQFRVMGRVRNADQNAVQDVKVVVTTYDAQGHVTGYRQQALEGGQLAPGAEQEFLVNFVPIGSSPVNYSVVAEGRFVVE